MAEAIGSRATRADNVIGSTLGVSVIVPTRNESGNIAPLVEQLDRVMAQWSDSPLARAGAEIIFVDDSDDQTPDAIRAAAQSSSMDVRLLHREPGRREGGLGGAVLAGFRLARGRWAVVMDGDLQHPPEKVPDLVAAAMAGDADVAYGTRYTGGYGADGLDGKLRQSVSAWSTRAARMLFPRRLRGVTDPMSGFFALRLDSVDLSRLRPSGFKILLEVLTRGGPNGVVGVPFEFQPRHDGQSKASIREGLTYLRRLISLRLGVSGPRLAQLTKFLLVGGTGVAVNTAALWLLSSVWSVPYLLGSVLATQIAIVWNFVLLERLVFHDSGRGFFSGLARFWVLNIVLLPVQLGLLALAVEVLGMPTVPANVVVLGVVFVLRYLFTAGWVFRWRADPLDVVTASAPRRRRWPTRSAAWFAARLCAPALVTLLAFPALVTHAADVFGQGNPLPAITMIAIVVAAITLVVARATPRPDEPPVHDRQVDSILALVFGAPSVWLTFGWATPLSVTGPIDARLLFAATGFLIAACLIVLGTRLTARIRLALAAPLLGLLPLAGLPAAGEIVAWVYVAVAAVISARWLRGTGRDREADLAMHQQFLPPVAPGLPFVVAAGATFGASAVLAQMGVLT